MAVRKKYRLLEMYSICVISVLISVVNCSKLPPSLDQVSEWGVELSTHLNFTVSRLSALNILQLNYQQASLIQNQGTDVHVNFEPVDSRSIVSDMSLSLSHMLGKKMDALKRSVEIAEKAAGNHTWNQTLQKEDVEYFNANMPTDIPLAYNERFKQDVSFNLSSVHIPVEIYNGDIQILNGLRWSASLDEIFEKNYEEDEEILWQYFGSQSGFMRTFPASRWIKHGDVDLYDVRRQSWYTQGSSSPKDMMILVDTSGSTHGQALQLMKVAVKSILDTLGENDFVNIASFSQEASFVSDCFNHTSFVQANYRNKKKLARDVDGLVAYGMANFKVGLRFAFEQFQLFERNNTNGMGATCNKVIMLLTDGGTDNAEDIFKEYNWPKNKSLKAEVRVFTYAVGPTANPTNAIRWMACANRGYFSQIPAMGAIRARVQGYTKYLATSFQYADVREHSTVITRDIREYIPVLSRPQVLKNVKQCKWGNIYADHLGLGMMTTVTLPVYNKSEGSSNQTILGVMGIDVTTKDLEKKAPKNKLGPNGYAFAINPNGYVIFHPNLRVSETYLEDPPDVDLLEVEINNPDKLKLRNKMIDEEDDKMEIRTLVLSPSLKYVSWSNLTYAFTPIKNTSFSLGVSIPAYQSTYPKFLGNINSFNQSVFKTNNDYQRKIAPWDYYKNMSLFENMTQTVDDIYKLCLQKDSNDDNWNKELLYQLYWDLKVISSIDKYYETIATDANTREDLEGLMIAFVATNGGLTQIYQHDKMENETFDSEELELDTWKADYYKRALNSEKFLFVPPEPQDVTKNYTDNPSIMVAHSISLRDLPYRIKYKPAVAGVKISHQKLQTEMVAISAKRDKAFPFALHCNDTESLFCYLLDDGGFLVSTNQEELVPQVGQFFGNVDPSVMHVLFNQSIYKRNRYFNYQASCIINTDKNVNAGPSAFKIPSINLFFDFLSVNWWSSKFSWLYVNFNIYNWLVSETTTYAKEKEDKIVIKSCVKMMYQYYFGEKEKFEDKFHCDNCTRSVRAVRLQVGNLLLVVTTPSCDECLDFYEPLPQHPIPVTEEIEDEAICSLSEEPRYRRHRMNCYDEDEREDDTKCGSGSILLYSKSYLTILSLVLICLGQLLTS
ncbi:hypothetical protein LOTGIDRAFT_238600 [Lottia gigantea]|uniref:VWFA domain-containing protein n=1 Tax=Lottia gigantea TaxID=225164 RepID=V4B1U9_LOTGI|nr:hypothetical protein LOTGIDRAFT_238600 [Lottia gigantea]ESP00317.1 hypothetical protein LOTGIDRAFT_238600 [Lottia gigantea]